METHEMKANNVSFKSKLERIRISKIYLIILFTFSGFIFSTSSSFAHCDQMDGPLILDARKAISQNNVNIVLKWVPADMEDEVKVVYDLMMKVRVLNPEAKELSERYFFETLVRIHRAGEGVPYTGVKPAGTPIDENVKAADEAIKIGNLSPLKGLVPSEKMGELTHRFEKVMAKKNYDVNNVEAGREYIEAYVLFFKFAEGESDGHGHESHAGKQRHD